MASYPSPADIGIDVQDHVAIVEMRRGPHNFFDLPFLVALADTFEALEADRDVRVFLLCAEGESFCAGANFGSDNAVPWPKSPRSINPIYLEALRLFSLGKPMVAAVQGAAVGGGLGLALVADFRVTCPEARFVANFARLGLSPGFGLTETLPRLLGRQKAADLFFTGRRIGGEEAVRIGLADKLVARDALRAEALTYAKEIAVSSPTVVSGTRTAMRRGFLDALRDAVAFESAEQHAQYRTADFKEGVAAMSERRAPVFKGE